jgi:predicted protein tyrosine phosphatase
MIHVCSLARLPETVELTGARHIITVMGRIDRVTRPASILPDNHLMVSMDDINAPAEGFNPPNAGHVAQLLDFARRWDRSAPLVVHCFAGISRSSATAFAAACALNPTRSELAIARQIRDASPSAFPNRLIVQLADELLGRQGRMVRAIDEIGPGIAVIEGEPFRVNID